MKRFLKLCLKVNYLSELTVTQLPETFSNERSRELWSYAKVRYFIKRIA